MLAKRNVLLKPAEQGGLNRKNTVLCCEFVNENTSQKFI